MPRIFSLWLSTGLVIHVVVGMAMDGYSLCYFDDALHFGIVGSLTFLVVSELKPCVKWQSLALPRSQLLVCGTLFALGIGALWEVFEFLVDLTGVYQAQRGLPDTMMDLVAGGAGGVIASLFYCWRNEALALPGIKPLSDG